MLQVKFLTCYVRREWYSTAFIRWWKINAKKLGMYSVLMKGLPVVYFTINGLVI